MSYMPHTPQEREEMLRAIGVGSVDDLFTNIPVELRSGDLDLPAGLSELEVLQVVGALAAENQDVEHRPSFLGAGAYNHYVPSAVPALVGRSEFYTAYTPYQAELSQGTLQVIYEYQTMIAALTGMDVSNASLYDAATAMAEAGTIAINQTGRQRLLVASGVHPEYRRVLRTYMEGQGFELTEVDEGWVADPETLPDALGEDVAAVMVQSPNFYGAIEPMSDLARRTHAAGAIFVAIVNPLSLAMLAPPGEYGADIAVGCGQPLGISLQFGGPYLGFMAVTEQLVRRLPGRLVGATVDNAGHRGYVLTLQAREQHIRREKATSNICTNHALMALSASVYLSLMGKAGLRELAELCTRRAHYAADEIASIPGFTVPYSAPFFNEFVVQTPVPAGEVNRFLLTRDIVGGFDLGRVLPRMDHYLLLAITELNDRQQIDDLVATLRELQPEPAGSAPKLQETMAGGAV